MADTGRFRAFYLSYLSSPAVDRPIYRVIQRQGVSQILELGVGAGRRARRMIELARHCCPSKKIQFVGLDLFEDRSSLDGPGVTLKMAHRLLKPTGARVQLIPGDPFSGLANAANSLGQVDLIVISPRLDPRSLARAWFYIPRLLHPQTKVFEEQLLRGGQRVLRPLDHRQIASLAAASVRRRAA